MSSITTITFVASTQWVTILALFVIPIIIMCLFKLKERKAGLKLPPNPPRLPFIGNLHQVTDRPHVAFAKLARTYGPVMQLKLGSKTAIVCSSPETARETMKDKDIECCSRPLSAGPRLLSYDFLDVAFSPFSNYWREMRKLFILELVSMKRINLFWYAREQEIDKMVAEMVQAYPNPVNLTTKIFESVDGFTGTVALGHNYSHMEFKDEFVSLIHRYMDISGSFTAEDYFPTVGKFIDYLTGKVAMRKKTFKKIDHFLTKVLQNHLEPDRRKGEREDIVDALISLMKDESSSFKITPTHIKSLVTNIYIGTVDTSANTSSWAMAELIKNPRVMKKAQAEVREVVGPNQKRVDAKDLDKLKYLECVLKETFRKHPVVPLLIPRSCMKQCKIGGYDVMPGTQIFINAWGIGHDPNVWKMHDPEEFYPERFEDSEIDYKGKHFELIPFGAGRRMCPGYAMGALAVKYILANLVYMFDYQLPGDMKFEDFPLEENIGKFVISTKHDVVVIAKKHEFQ